MKRKLLILSFLLSAVWLSVAFKDETGDKAYQSLYRTKVDRFIKKQQDLLRLIHQGDLQSSARIAQVSAALQQTRSEMKGLDFWFRYLEPTTYKKVNGPLPVEWETEVFEKFEKPYKREGAGLTLATLYLGETSPDSNTLSALISASLDATSIYLEDSITGRIDNYHHFYLCNRLFILNLAAIYTTGFDCPDTKQIIPELRAMMATVRDEYMAFNESFPAQTVSADYLNLYDRAISFVQKQPDDYAKFDHFGFIRDYVNPLFVMNQDLISRHKVVSRSMVDYSLNKNAISIFDKGLYNGQNSKGIFLRVNDAAVLAEIDKLGKLLFYDPILSANNMRSCASCHKPEQMFADTLFNASPAFDRKGLLARNTPSLVNAGFNHLIMLDGAHFTLQNQTRSVIMNENEMGSNPEDLIKKVLSCKEYKAGFTALLKYTPQEPEVTIEHLSSAITYYYGKFSKASSPFDDAMNKRTDLSGDVQQGFNLFMSKAQCATCHFVPQFNGVKPPFIGSEFEVLGVPADTLYKMLSADKGRHGVNAALETMNAFRTGSLRNSMRTKPYMHNGVFGTMDQVIEFYNNGGGIGHGLKVDNQTLSADSLKLTIVEKKQLVAFLSSLNENIPFEKSPERLPVSRFQALNKRKVSGIY